MRLFSSFFISSAESAPSKARRIARGLLAAFSASRAGGSSRRGRRPRARRTPWSLRIVLSANRVAIRPPAVAATDNGLRTAAVRRRGAHDGPRRAAGWPAGIVEVGTAQGTSSAFTRAVRPCGG
ncbi:MAG: hypothetical protein ABSF64_36870 [Bryobacteraceae bacterium]